MDRTGLAEVDPDAPEFARMDGLRALFLDFGSFFASCEQQRDAGEWIRGTMRWEPLRGGTDCYDRPTARQSVGRSRGRGGRL